MTKRPTAGHTPRPFGLQKTQIEFLVALIPLLLAVLPSQSGFGRAIWVTITLFLMTCFCLASERRRSYKVAMRCIAAVLSFALVGLAALAVQDIQRTSELADAARTTTTVPASIDTIAPAADTPTTLATGENVPAKVAESTDFSSLSERITACEGAMDAISLATRQAGTGADPGGWLPSPIDPGSPVNELQFRLERCESTLELVAGAMSRR